MANTTLQIRHSTVAGNTPPSLANGEIAINSRDGILYYSTPSGTVTALSAASGPSGLNKEIQFNDSGSLGGSEKLTFDKTTGELVVNGTVRANIFSDDGIDLYDFSNRAFTTANAAFNAANTGAGQAGAFNQANAAFATANSKTFTFEQNTSPSTANSSDFWINIDTGALYQNFGNAANPVWAEVGPTGTLSNTLPGAISATTLTMAGSNGSISGANTIFTNYVFAANGNVDLYIHSSNAYANANGAFAKANAAFANANSAFTRANNSLNANTGGSVTGNITIVGNITSNSISASNTVNVTYTPSTTIGAALNLSAANTQGGTGYADFLKVTNSSGGATNPNKTFRLSSVGGVEVINSAYTATLMSLSDTGLMSIALPYQVAGKQAVNGPAFSAYANATLQTITSGSQQKVLFQTEEFDTNNNYASSRFTPTVEGYYQLNAEVRLDGASGTGEMMIVIYKNGTEYKRGINQSGTQIASSFWAMQVSSLVYANGTTDYFEIYVQQSSGASVTVTAVNNTAITWFNGCMLRGA